MNLKKNKNKFRAKNHKTIKAFEVQIKVHRIQKLLKNNVIRIIIVWVESRNLTIKIAMKITKVMYNILIIIKIMKIIKINN